MSLAQPRRLPRVHAEKRITVAKRKQTAKSSRGRLACRRNGRGETKRPAKRRLPEIQFFCVPWKAWWEFPSYEA